MNYTKLVSKRKQYKYSVNICFDLRDEERIAGFIPNVTTTEIIREYLGGMIRDNSPIHSRILYGSYGTGKSHLLTVLSAVLGHINIQGSGFKNFTKLISKYDQELAEDIVRFSKEDRPYFIVPVYSDYDDFGKCITFSLKKELERNGITVPFKGFFDEALELIERWSTGEDSSARLEEICSAQRKSVNELKKGLAAYDIKYEAVFKSVYSDMTYGADFNSTAGNLIDNMNAANEAIRDRFRGIVLVFDEFGRYVEDYGESLKVKSVQDLAEYCDHSDYNNHLILVSHKQLSLYTDAMKKSISDEWKKVEGRFKPTSINIKYDQCLSLIGNIIPKNKTYWEPFKNKYESQLYDLYTQAWDFKGFMIPPDSGVNNPFEDGFPLHPITLFALDRLSKKVAQNERTFFTYLAGDEETALFSQLQMYDVEEFHFIGLDSIYDYFELNIKSFKTDEAYSIYKKLQYALNKLGSDDNGYQSKVLKTIAVITIIGDSDVLIADRDTLSCVIDGDPALITRAIDDLEKKKIIKFMRQYGYYDYFDSSIFDLEEMIEEKLAGINDEMVVRILNEKFADFVLYPYKYNENFYVNRVFLPIFANKNELTKKSIFSNLPKYYDGIVIFVLDDHAEQDDYSHFIGLPKRSVLVVNGKTAIIEDEVKRYIALQYYFSKKEELAEDDPTVVNELSLYLSEQEAIIVDLVRKWRLLEDRNTFVMCNGVVADVHSEADLSLVLSEMMFESFDKTPKINNDLLNKNTLTGAIKLARKKALECVISQDDIYSGLQFLSPEFNIVRSTLTKNGLVPNENVSKSNWIDENGVNKLPNGMAAGLPVMNAIKSYLEKAKDGRLLLQELYETLKSEPFGLRDGYIPVLIAYALRNYQNVSIYFHGNEHSYNEEELLKALSDPDNYSLFLSNWTEEELAYIEGLERIFASFISREEGMNRLEVLFRAINAHYSSISKSARTTELYVSDIAKKYRDILNISYKDYNAFFFNTLTNLNDDLQELVIQIDTIKQELESVEEKQYIRVVHVIRQVLGIDDKDDLVRAVEAIYHNSWEAKRQIAFDYTTNNLLDTFAKAKNANENKLVLDIGKAATGFELAYWSDNKIHDFEETLRESVNKLNGYEMKESLQEGEMKITIESSDGTPLISHYSKDSLSVTAKMMLNKLKNTVDDFGESISYEEKVSVLAEVLKDIIG